MKVDDRTLLRNCASSKLGGTCVGLELARRMAAPLLPGGESPPYPGPAVSEPNAAPRPQHSLAAARERDACVCWLLESHPATAAMLVSLGWFPSKNKALKRLRRLVEKKRVRLAGTVCRKAGRPEQVYCRSYPKPDQLLHEVGLTELCLRIDAGTILRGAHVADAELRPDAELWIKGRLYYLELDRGTMGHAQIDGRFRQYEGRPHFVLWVCSTEERRKGMRERAEKLRATALFATMADALASPHGEVWVDYQGQRAALPRERENRGG
jgi:hypothetical protein